MSRFDEDLRAAAAPLAREPLPDSVLDDALETAPARRAPSLFAAVAALVATALVLTVVAGGLTFLRSRPTDFGAGESPSPAVTASGAEQSSRPDPTQAPTSGPLVATVEEDGIRVALELDRGQVAPGERVWASVTVENVGSDDVHWGHSSSCLFGADVSARPPEPSPLEYGRVADDLLSDDVALLKEIMIHRGLLPEYSFTPELLVDTENLACTSDLVSDVLRPGAVLTYRAAWEPEGPNGMPPAGGKYIVTGRFAYFGRGAAPNPALGPSFTSVGAELPLLVQAPETEFLSPGLAFDRIAEDPRFVAALEGSGPERWPRAPTMEWQGGTWVMRIEMINPSETLTAAVDAATGEVLTVELAE